MDRRRTIARTYLRGKSCSFSLALSGRDPCVLSSVLKLLVQLGWSVMWFEAILGLKINLSKSEIITMGRVENMEEMVVELGCKVEALPSSYLGLLLGAPHNSVVVWDGLERFHKRLALWKRQ